MSQAPVKKPDADLDEEVPMDFPKKEASKVEPADNDDKLEELLAGLDD